MKLLLMIAAAFAAMLSAQTTPPKVTIFVRVLNEAGATVSEGSATIELRDSILIKSVTCKALGLAPGESTQCTAELNAPAWKDFKLSFSVPQGFLTSLGTTTNVVAGTSTINFTLTRLVLAAAVTGACPSVALSFDPAVDGGWWWVSMAKCGCSLAEQITRDSCVATKG